MESRGERRWVYVFDQSLRNFVEKERFEPSQVGEQVLFTLDSGESWNEGMVEEEEKSGRRVQVTRSEQSFESGQKVGIGYDVILVPMPTLDSEMDINK
jgi:hypothetical protein